MPPFAHHAEAFLAVEINGRPFPDGMTEHGLAIGLLSVLLAFCVYGVYAGRRDFRAWRRKPAAPIVLPT